jgi:hypothetical protein
MENLNFNFKDLENSEAYKQGKKDFKEGKIKNEGAKYKWYSKIVSKKEWEIYSKSGYTFLSEDGGNVRIGFLAVIPPLSCLEITDVDDLLKIQRHREATNSFPQPMEIK